MTTKKQPFEDVSPIKDDFFHPVMLVFWKVSARLLHFFFLVVLAIQIGLVFG